MDYHKVTEGIVAWIKEKVSEAGAKGVILGLSGGIDSAVAMVLCKKAFPENCLGLVMPCHSNAIDEADAKLAAEYFDFPYKIVILDEVYDTLLSVSGEAKSKNSNQNMAFANIKPRLRMTTLYFEAALRNYLVTGTGNKSEIVIGYYTKYGDGGVDIEPLGSLVKTQVRELAKFLGIPDEIITKPPTAGLWGNQTDEQEMGLTYNELDQYILTGHAKPQNLERIQALVFKSEHKRHMPPVAPLRQ